jgi:hypothetical protein
MHYKDEWWLNFILGLLGVGRILHFVCLSAALVPCPETPGGVARHSAQPNAMLFHVNCAISHGLFN